MANTHQPNASYRIAFFHFYLFVAVVTSIAAILCVTSWWHDYQYFRQQEKRIAAQLAEKNAEVDQTIATVDNNPPLVPDDTVSKRSPSPEPLPIPDGVQSFRMSDHYSGNMQTIVYENYLFTTAEMYLGFNEDTSRMLLRFPLTCEHCGDSFELIMWDAAWDTHIFLTTTAFADLPSNTDDQVIVTLPDTSQYLVADIIRLPNEDVFAAPQWDNPFHVNGDNLYITSRSGIYMMSHPFDDLFFIDQDLTYYQPIPSDASLPYAIMYRRHDDHTTYYIFYPATKHLQELFSDVRLAGITSDHRLVIYYYDTENRKTYQIGLVSIDTTNETISSNDIWISHDNLPVDSSIRYYDDQLFFCDNNSFIYHADLEQNEPILIYDLDTLANEQLTVRDEYLSGETLTDIVNKSDWALVNTDGKIIGGETMQNFENRTTTDKYKSVAGLCLCHEEGAHFADEKSEGGGAYFDFRDNTFRVDYSCYHNGRGDGAFPCGFGTNIYSYQY
ncbi:hypothetical protein IJJ12_00345 [bacterium]|nr:hypothetical protein [bacterium]